MKSNFKVLLFYIVLIAGIILAVVLLFGSQANNDDPKYSDINQYLTDAEATLKYNADSIGNQAPKRTVIIKSANVTEDYKVTLEMTVGKDDGTTTEEKVVYKASVLVIENIVDRLEAYDEISTTFELEVEPETVYPWWLSFLPYVVIIIIFIFLWFFIMNQAMGGKGSKMNSFGKARVKTPATDKNTIRFSDVAGADRRNSQSSAQRSPTASC